MDSSERPIFTSERNDRRSPQAIIIGGGLSGSVLGAVLARNEIPVTVIEARPSPEQLTAKYYLVTSEVAAALGMEREWLSLVKEQGRIGGFSTYGVTEQNQLTALEGLSASWLGNRPKSGFVVFSQAEIINHLWTSIVSLGGKVISGSRVIGLELLDGNQRVNLADGSKVEGNLLIDATGVNLERRKGWGLRPTDIDSQARVRAVFGFQVSGEFPSDRLLFLTGLRKAGFANELLAWLMPKGSNKAQVVINQEVSQKEALGWYKGAYQRWEIITGLFNKTGEVKIGEKIRPAIASGFRASPASFKEMQRLSQPGEIPFGELLGFNWPGIGQLIDIISQDASLLAELITEEPFDIKRFYRGWNKRLNYPLLTALAKTRQDWLRRTGLSANPLSLTLTKQASPEELWSTIRGGNLLSKNIFEKILTHPECWGFLAQALIKFFSRPLRGATAKN